MKKALMYGILEVFDRLKGFEIAWFLKFLYKKPTMVLMFHRVGDDGSIGLPSISISKENYIKLISMIQNFFNVVSVNDYVDYRKRKNKLPRRPILLTFDDGYNEIYENAVTPMVDQKIPATIFAVTSTLGSQSVYWWDVIYAFLLNVKCETPIPAKIFSLLPEDLKQIFDLIVSSTNQERRPMIFKFIEEIKKIESHACEEISAQLKEIYEKHFSEKYLPIAKTMNHRSLLQLETNGWAIGSHTVTHRFLNNISLDEVKVEVRQSKEELEKITQKEIVAFAYPAGIYSDEIAKVVQESGYTLAFTTQSGVNSSDTNMFELKRINVWDGFVCNYTGKFSRAATLWRLLTA